MLNIGKVELKCITCDGTGKIQHPEWIIWWLDNKEAPPEGHPLLKVKETMVCPECFGFGAVVRGVNKTL